MTKFAFPLRAVCLLALLAIGCGQTETSQPSDVQAVRGPITVEIETPSGQIKRLTAPDVAAGTSVESLMRSLEEVEVAIRGSGTTAFVQSLDGTATGTGKGWTFTIDGEFAMKGIGQTELEPPATIRWSYGEFSVDSASDDAGSESSGSE
jgi:hypothetical protein